MKNNKIYKAIMLVILTAIITFMVTIFSLYSYFGVQLLNVDSKNTNENSLITSIESNKNLERYLDRINSTINKYYLWKDNINEKDLKESAIKGYVSGLGDEYTEYITAEEMKEYKTEIAGNFVGIGIYMIADKESGKIVIYYPIPNSPAEKAGLQIGDVIISVDDIKYSIDDFNIMADKIKGKEGTSVKVVVDRDGKQIEYNIIREKITLNPISTKIINDNIGYLKLPSFDEETSSNFKEKVINLQSQGAKSLIIDLRNNGGGIVEEATNIADYFLDKEKNIISTVNNKNNKETTRSKDDPIFTMPVIVIVNENTASASEILTCSLKENNRAKVVGTKTFGKGIIQTVFSLTDGSGLKITTEEYYTPNGNTIHKVGVTPDEEIKLPDTVKNIYLVEEEQDTQLKKAIEILK